MITYQSIRLYISSPASILPNSFYDVVGFYGAQIGSSTNPYHIDPQIYTYPVIKVSGQYYYLTYRDTDGFIPNVVEFGDSNLHLLEGAAQMPIYLNQRDDAHIISNYDSPLGANITIDNIDNLYVAYRILTVQVYDNYAIESFGAIVDNNNIIDVVDADFVLAATNPDGIAILPSAGNVNSLYSFELTYTGRTITAADIACLRKIALYDYNTQAVAIGVDVNSITYTLGQQNTKVTFSLLSEITAPSLYFLYIPSGTFTYDTGNLSQMAMFAYNIQAISGGGSIFEFIYSPTQTKRLKTVKMKYVNVLSVTGVSLMYPVILSYDNTTESFSASEVLSASGNEVIIEFPEAYINTGDQNKIYTITLHTGAVIVRDGQSNQEEINLEIAVVPDGAIMESTDYYDITVVPGSGEVYDVSYANIFITFKPNITGEVVRTEGHEFSEIVVVNPITNEAVDHITSTQIKNAYLNEENRYTYEFDCRFSRKNNSEPSYKILIPGEVFQITAYANGESNTYYNGEILVSYTIKSLPPQDDGDNQDPTTTTFDYKLITIRGTTGISREHVVFRPAGTDTIVINRDNFAQLLTCPCLSVTKLDHANANSVISKETLTLRSGDIMNVSVRTTYYNSEYVDVSTTATMDYGLRGGTFVNSDLSSIFPVFRNGYPNYFRLTYLFNYNGTEISRNIEFQFLPDFIFEQFRVNQAWKRNLRFDLYSGTQTDYQYGCMFLTNNYDIVLSYTETQEPTQEGEESTTITHYVAELVPTTKVRTGNLRGIYNETFGANQPQGFGLYGENVYLTGNFYLNNGKSLMDISDDILLANGNINEIRDSFKNLDTSIKATIESLSLRQETFENGLDASIKDYISTNKNAVLKIGTDYSLWSLGSAGISMINPNATYDFDPISGNYSVNPDTVGDGDEYIALQGDKIKFSTYKQTPIKTEDEDKDYIEVICTTISPEVWLYPETIYEPKLKRSTGYNNVEFFLGYVEALPHKVHSISIQETTVEFLKYIRFESGEIVDGNFLPSTEGIEENAEYYTFANYYMCTAGTATNNPDELVRLKSNVPGETYYQLDSALDSIGSNATIYYVPRVVVAGMFYDGKFNADYIEAKNLVAVDTNPVEEPLLDENNQIQYDENGNVIKHSVQKYRKNPRFNPLARIVSDPEDPDYNYPVLNINNNNPAKDASFVVVSGSTGKITARGADIRGTIIVGDETSNEDGGYIVLSDGNNNITQNSGLFLYSRKNGETNLAAAFDGVRTTDPTGMFKSFRELPSITDGYKDRSVTYTPQATGSWRWYSYGDNGGSHSEHERSESDPYSGNINYNEDDDYNPGGYNWFNWQVSYRTNASTSFIGKLLSNNTVHKIDLAPRERVVIKLKSGTFETRIKYTGNPRGDTDSATVTATLVIIDSQDNIVSDEYSTYSRTTTVTSSTAGTFISGQPVIFSDRDITFTNPLNEQATFYLGYKLSVNFYYNDNNNNSYDASCRQAPEVGTGTSYPPVTITASAKVVNLVIAIGSEGFTTKVFGNGLISGYNYQNYFTTYYQTSGNPRMIIDFRSLGVGMSYDDGVMYNYVANQRVKAYVTILQGRVDYDTVTVSNSTYGYYKFKGVSLIKGSYASGDSLRTYNYVPLMKYAPRFGDVVHESTTGVWPFQTRHYSNGKPYNMGSNTEVNSDSFVCNYDSDHDLYIVRGTEGQVIIYFGIRWENLLNSVYGTFLTEDQTFVSATGIGRELPEQSNYALPGTIYASVKAIKTFSNGANTDCVIVKSSDENQEWVPNEYGGEQYASAHPVIKNMLQIALSDDSNLNDGSFYLSIAFCPNNVQ